MSTPLRVFTVLVLVCALFGLTRVALAAKVSEAAIDAERLRSDIQEEMRTSENLEVQRSALASPSRIEVVARASMGMAEPGAVDHMSLAGVLGSGADAPGAGGGGEDAPAVASAAIGTDVAAGAARASYAYATDTDPSAAGLVGELMDMAAGEAQVLLVGDVGLASGR